MDKNFESEKEIRDLVRSFEEATVSRDDWRHAEHLVVGLYYLDRHGMETATAKMRDGIFNLLTRGFSVDLTKEMPYHETLTVFWMRTTDQFNSSKDGASLMQKANEIVETYDKDYPLKFYSRDLLFSDKARAGFVESDLEQPK